MYRISGEGSRARTCVSTTWTGRVVDQLLRVLVDPSIARITRPMCVADVGVADSLNGWFVTERQTSPDCTGCVT